MEVNPEVVINDLLDQIRRLTLENSLLRSALAEHQQADAAAVAELPDEDK